MRTSFHTLTALSLLGQEPDIVMATHDVALATAARACGLAVVGGS